MPQNQHGPPSWSTKEKLVLVSCMQKYNIPLLSPNLTLISSCLQSFFDNDRSSSNTQRAKDKFSERNCAEHLKLLLKELGESKAKERNRDTPLLQYMVDQLREKRMEEILTEMEAVRKSYRALKEEEVDEKSLAKEVETEEGDELKVVLEKRGTCKKFGEDSILVKEKEVVENTVALEEEPKAVEVATRINSMNPVVILTDIFAFSKKRSVAPVLTTPDKASKHSSELVQIKSAPSILVKGQSILLPVSPTFTDAQQKTRPRAKSTSPVARKIPNILRQRNPIKSVKTDEIIKVMKESPEDAKPVEHNEKTPVENSSLVEKSGDATVPLSQASTVPCSDSSYSDGLLKISAELSKSEDQGFIFSSDIADYAIEEIVVDSVEIQLDPSIGLGSEKLSVSLDETSQEIGHNDNTEDNSDEVLEDPFMGLSSEKLSVSLVKDETSEASGHHDSTTDSSLDVVVLEGKSNLLYKLLSQNPSSESDLLQPTPPTDFSLEEAVLPATPDVKSELTKTQRKILANMVEQFKLHKHSSLFLRPPNPKANNQLYLGTVKRTMDLHTLKRKVDLGCISSLEEFQRDLRLIFMNAVMYYPVESDIPEKAIAMERDCFATLSTNIAAQWNSETKKVFRNGVPEDMKHLSHLHESSGSLAPASSTRGRLSVDPQSFSEATRILKL
ncbi:bromodomain-containing protein 8-like [Neocloeon triangulifer]|uniref:bromodomain-containing protein 8-like n=1 Tax=Neocloeon triangulifer TaxID=2078957 RepID=UPI00286F3CA3|nr:bromodomain-containing protein 8-like [Neocloeon triangulifer]XP_059475310.1 bromodomain-containing protein 8-like [Neocloeon triangulifer]